MDDLRNRKKAFSTKSWKNIKSKSLIKPEINNILQVERHKKKLILEETCLVLIEGISLWK